MNGRVERAGVTTQVARETDWPVTQLGRFLCLDLGEGKKYTKAD